MKKFDHNIAQNYEADIRKKVPGYELCHEFLSTLLSLDQEKEREILVVGSGTGEELSRLTQLSSEWNIVGVEPSLPMVGLAKDFLGTQVEIIHSRIEDYEREEKFDYILSILVSHFIPYEEKKSFFEHLSGLLNPQGKLILFDLFKTSEELHETWLRWSSTQGLDASESEAMRKNVKEKFFPMSLKEFDEVLGSLELKREESFIQCLGFNGIIITK